VQKNSVEIAWSAPTDDGGAPIVGYVVEYCEESAFFWLPANDGEQVTGTRCHVRGLAENTAYKFRVAAKNKAGNGPTSECVLPVQVQEPFGEYLRSAICCSSVESVAELDEYSWSFKL